MYCSRVIGYSDFLFVEKCTQNLCFTMVFRVLSRVNIFVCKSACVSKVTFSKFVASWYFY